MNSPFDEARQLIRASIEQCFSRDWVVKQPDGKERKIQGYIKHQSRDGHTIQRLLTSSYLPPLSTMMVKGKCYCLVHSGYNHGQVKHESQLQREYLLNLSKAGGKHDFSEF
ncbi:hypothetical protein [Photobacterium leiognathi]|uniref:hypothetical protein n=1 Tax=Photobacterium leiognathi TaxID=553611 RepID=UPI002982525F|nr:hypothetical protein [Photobacterium leiognathi]